MALIICKECGKEISSDVKVCPNCGAETAQGKLRGEWTGLLISFGIGCVFLIWGFAWIFKYVEIFFDFMGSNSKEFLWNFYDDVQEGVWRFIFACSFLIGGLIDVVQCKKKYAVIEAKERAYKRRAEQEYQSRKAKSSNGYEILRNGDWRCICGRVNSHYTSTCACGKSKSELAKQAGETENGRWICKACNSQNPPTAHNCVRCGGLRENKRAQEQEKPQESQQEETVKRQFCGYCGAKLAENVAFCSSCGKKQ